MTTLKPYPDYKDSGVEWLGDLPVHWQIQRLKTVSAIRPGATPKSDNEAYWDGEVLWATPEDVSKSHRLRSTRRTITEAGLASCAAIESPPGSIIVTCRAPIGNVAIAEKPMATNQGCKTAVPLQNKVESLFLYRVLTMAKTELQSLGSGSTFQEISTGDMAGLRLPLPPLDEQHAIAGFLDGMDARITRFIAARRKMIALLEEKKQAVINQAVTRGLDPSVPMKDSGVDWLGEIPAHWQVLPLKRWLSTPITDGPHETPVFVDSGIDFVSAESMVGGRIDFDRRRGYISEQLHREYSKKLHPQINDIFMCKSGATTGKLAIVDDGREFSVWSPLALIRADRERVLPQLLFRVLHATYVQKQVQQTWSYGTQPNLSMGAMARLSVALPGIEEQASLLSHIDCETFLIDSLIARHRREIDLMQEYRTRLISDVVTGKLDVRGVELPAVEEVIGEEIESAMEEELPPVWTEVEA